MRKQKYGDKRYLIMKTFILFNSILIIFLFSSCATFEKNTNSAMGAMDIAVTRAKTLWEEDQYKVTSEQIKQVNSRLISYEKAKEIFAKVMFAYDRSQTINNQYTVDIALTKLNYAAINVVDLIIEFDPDVIKNQ